MSSKRLENFKRRIALQRAKELWTYNGIVARGYKLRNGEIVTA